MGSEGAACFHSFSDESRELTKEQWDKERFGQICSDSDAFANWKKAILKLCRVSKMCTYEDRAALRKLSNFLYEHEVRVQKILSERNAQ